jgi:hypothetical protein
MDQQATPTQDPAPLRPEELESEQATELPDREAMSLVSADPAGPLPLPVEVAADTPAGNEPIYTIQPAGENPIYPDEQTTDEARYQSPPFNPDA